MPYFPFGHIWSDFYCVSCILFYFIFYYFIHNKIILAHPFFMCGLSAVDILYMLHNVPRFCTSYERGCMRLCFSFLLSFALGKHFVPKPAKCGVNEQHYYYRVSEGGEMKVHLCRETLSKAFVTDHTSRWSSVEAKLSTELQRTNDLLCSRGWTEGNVEEEEDKHWSTGDYMHSQNSQKKNSS